MFVLRSTPIPMYREKSLMDMVKETYENVRNVTVNLMRKKYKNTQTYTYNNIVIISEEFTELGPLIPKLDH